MDNFCHAEMIIHNSGEFMDVDDITVGSLTKTNPLTILALIAVAVGVVVLIIFLYYLPSKPLVVTHDSDWVLESYRDSTGILLPVIDGTEITARFGNNGNLSGRSGCNDYSAAYLIMGKQIVVSSPAQTRMLCGAPGIMQQESAFLADLPTAAYLQTGGTGMKILNNQSKIMLTFRQV
jgi:heat shock protein HslJ